jgi:hypothetical protein
VAKRTYACHLRRRFYRSVVRSVRSVHLEVVLLRRPGRSLRCCVVVRSFGLSSRRLYHVSLVCERVPSLTEIRHLHRFPLCCSCHLLELGFLDLVPYLRHVARRRWLSKDLATLGCAKDWAVGVVFHRDSRAVVSVSSIEVVVMDSLCSNVTCGRCQVGWSWPVRAPTLMCSSVPTHWYVYSIVSLSSKAFELCSTQD